jgi:hypothetical protein
VFGCLLHSRFFDNLKGLSIHKQASFPIIFDGIKFILTSTNAPITYLGWVVLVILAITIRFTVDQHPFLLEDLA